MARSKGKSATDLNNFTIIHNEFIETDLLDGYEKLVFIAIKRHISNQDYTAFPSIKKICSHTRLSKPTVIKAIKGLEEKHIIKVEHRESDSRGHMSNLYTLYDYKNMWKASSKSELAAVVEEEEEQRLINLLESKGYVVTKEKELECEPTKAHTQALENSELNQFDMVNTTTNSMKSQYTERYTIEQIRQLYDYDYLISDTYISNNDVETVISVLYDALNTTKSSIRVDGEDKPTMVVISKLMKLDSESVKYAISKYHEQTERIKNVNAYLLTILYHAKEQSYLDLMNQGHTNGDF